MQDKQKVANLTHIPNFLPEITIGAHEYDEKYYAYRSVCRRLRCEQTANYNKAGCRGAVSDLCCVQLSSSRVLIF